LPCSVDALLQMIEHAGVCDADVFVDIGSGVGRAAAFVHLMTGASAIGLEIQPQLVSVARGLSSRLLGPRVACVEGDAQKLVGHMALGSVFFFYCPFSGERLRSVLADLEAIAQTRPLRVCCVDVPLPPSEWLKLERSSPGGLAIYRSQ
jgi:predicted RNA methylase